MIFVIWIFDGAVDEVINDAIWQVFSIFNSVGIEAFQRDCTILFSLSRYISEQIVSGMWLLGRAR